MYESKMMIVIRHDLNMRKGKIAAQASHACVEVTLSALAKEGRLNDICADGGFISLKETDKEKTPLSEWFLHGTAKICVYVNSLEELLEIRKKTDGAGLISSLICDAGYTEFHGESTYTCLAVEPALPCVIDSITGDLPLF